MMNTKSKAYLIWYDNKDSEESGEIIGWNIYKKVGDTEPFRLIKVLYKSEEDKKKYSGTKVSKYSDIVNIGITPGYLGREFFTKAEEEKSGWYGPFNQKWVGQGKINKVLYDKGTIHVKSYNDYAELFPPSQAGIISNNAYQNTEVNTNGKTNPYVYYDDSGDELEGKILKTKKLAFDKNSEPLATAFFQQRSCFSLGSNLILSEVAKRHSFKISTTSDYGHPLSDDDALELGFDEVMKIQHITNWKGLMIFGIQGEFFLVPNEKGAISWNCSINKIGGVGSSHIAPQVTENAVFFINRNRSKIYRRGREEEEITFFANHFFRENKLMGMAYQENPNNQLFFWRDDGKVICCTHSKEQDINAFSLLDYGGFVESMCFVPEKRTHGGKEWFFDSGYMSILRDAVRMIEVMSIREIRDQKEMVFMDSAVSFSNLIEISNFAPNAWKQAIVLFSGGIDKDSSDEWAPFYGKFEESFEITNINGAESKISLNKIYKFNPKLSDGSLSDIRWEMQNEDGSSLGFSFSGSSLTSPVGKKVKQVVKKITGLGHLNGKEVSVLGDGYVVASPLNYRLTDPYGEDVESNRKYEYNQLENRRVVGGKIILKTARSVVHVGLPFQWKIETLDLDLQGQKSAFGEPYNIQEIALWVDRLRGIFVGRSKEDSERKYPLDGYSELKPRDREDKYKVPRLKTGVKTRNIFNSWRNQAGGSLTGVDPLPTSILAIILKGILPQAGDK